jgi:hypothetical protein
MRAGLVRWIAGAVALAGGAQADETCAEAPLIAGMAGAIIEGRADLPGLHQRRFGAEAVYLALHYGGMDEAAARDLLATLAAENVTDARDVLAVLVMAREGVEAGLAVIDADPVRAFATAGLPVRRAVLMADGGESYFRLMREAEARPELAEGVGQFLAGGGEMVTLTAGMEDAALAQVVAAAEAEGRILLAIKLAAGLRDLSTFQRLMQDHADLPEVAEFATFSWMEANVFSLRHGGGPLPRPDAALQAERGAGDARLYAVFRAAWESGPEQFILTFMNQTGLEAEVAAVAQAYLAEVGAGRIDPVADPDAAWLVQYEGLGLVMEPAALQGTLGAFDWPPRRLRHYAGTAVESLDWMLAAQALGPVVRGEVAGVPERPAMMTPEFDWALWTGLAEQIAGGGVGALPPESLGPAAELLIAAERWDDLAGVAAQMEPEERLMLTRDAMQRLDRRCDAWMASEGQGLMGGAVMWRF